jgi:hypothetical protein
MENKKLTVFVQKRQEDDAIVIRGMGRRPSSATAHHTIKAGDFLGVSVRVGPFGDKTLHPQE